jgi:hypothetical protein
MEFNFTIGWSFIQFFFHFVAAILYMCAGFELGSHKESVSGGVYLLFIAMGLTYIGCKI